MTREHVTRGIDVDDEFCRLVNLLVERHGYDHAEAVDLTKRELAKRRYGFEPEAVPVGLRLHE